MGRQASVDDVQRLAELLMSRDRDDEKEKIPQLEDPRKYPRHVQVLDEDSLARVAKLDALIEDLRQLMRRGEIIEAKLKIEQNELFEGLERAYPTIRTLRRGRIGLRDWQAGWWYVGWDQGWAPGRDGGEDEYMPKNRYL